MTGVVGAVDASAVQVEGALAITSTRFADSTPGTSGGGDVFLDVANSFTQPQSIDVTVPVTPYANVGTTKPTVLLHLHDQNGALHDQFAAKIDFGGGVIIASGGTLTPQIGPDGEYTDAWLMVSYGYVGEGDDGALYRLLTAEVTSTDPGELPWLSDIMAATAAPVRIGDATESTDAVNLQQMTLAIGVEATARGAADTVLTEAIAEEVTERAKTLVSASSIEPTQPSRSSSAVWVRTQGDLRAFVDFSLLPDGPVDRWEVNGPGSESGANVASFLVAYPAYGGEIATIRSGAVQSSGIDTGETDPTPRVGFTFTGVVPGAVGRIEWGHDGFTVGDAANLVDYIPTNVAISDDDHNAYLMGVVVGRFDTGADTTDPGNAVSARMRLIRDDLAAPTTIASAALPRMPRAGDRFAFTWNADGELAGLMNGVEIVTVTETTYDISTFTGIGMPMHQGSDLHTWQDCYYTSVQWFGISGGDPITRRLGPHTWTGTPPTEAGWFPSPDTDPPLRMYGANVALDATGFTGNLDTATTDVQLLAEAVDALAGSGGAVDSVNGATGTVVLDATDVGAQPADSDLTAIAALTTTSFGRSLLELASATATRTALGFGTTKVASDVPASDTTLLNTTGLSFAVVNGSSYYFRALMWVTGNSAGDIDTAVTAPTGPLYATTFGLAAAASAQPGQAHTITATSSGERMNATGVITGATVAIVVEGTFTATADGTVQIQHSQRSANGTATTVKAGSALTFFTT